MSDDCKRILGPFTGRKKRKAWNNTREKHMPEERKQNLAETSRWSYYNQEEWLEELLDDKSASYDASEGDNKWKWWWELYWKYRSSRSQMFFKIGILKDFTNFTGKHPCWSSFLIKLQSLRMN